MREQGRVVVGGELSVGKIHWNIKLWSQLFRTSRLYAISYALATLVYCHSAESKRGICNTVCGWLKKREFKEKEKKGKDERRSRETSVWRQSDGRKKDRNVIFPCVLLCRWSSLYAVRRSSEHVFLLRRDTFAIPGLNVLSFLSFFSLATDLCYSGPIGTRVNVYYARKLVVSLVILDESQRLRQIIVHYEPCI